MIRALFFDIDNTLLDFDACVRQTMREGFAFYGLRPYEEFMFDTFTRINSALWLEIEQGKLDLPSLQKVRWNRIFQNLNISFDGIVFEDYFVRTLNQSIIEVQNAFTCVRKLSETYLICAASNGPWDQQEGRLRMAGILPCFTRLFISERIGVSKPSPRFFEAALSELNQGRTERIHPEEILMIGDSLSSDIRGGKDFGMKTCYFNRYHRSLSGPLFPDHTIHRLDELFPLLEMLHPPQAADPAFRFRT